ncbi:MAG: hypothetical protein ABIR50_01850 [Ginsengibacter sp.]
MQNLQLAGQGKYGKATVKVDVPVMLFEEEKNWFAYLPSFDLTGYGNNPEEAKESLKIVLDEFIRYSLNKKTFFEELRRLGWEIKSKNRPIHAPKMSDLIQKNDQLKDIINSKQYSTANYQVNVPAYA